MLELIEQNNSYQQGLWSTLGDLNVEETKVQLSKVLRVIYLKQFLYMLKTFRLVIKRAKSIPGCQSKVNC